MTQEKTIFQKIIAGEIPCHKIYEDENTFAFLDISPNTKGHTLVIPKEPFKNIYDIDEETAGKLFQSVRKIATAIKKSLKTEGANIVMNNNPVAGQEVLHAHIHIVPRHKDDAGWYGKKYQYKDEEAEEIAQKIRENL